MNYPLISLIFCALLAKSWTAHLPANGELLINQLAFNHQKQEQQQQQQHEHIAVPLNETAALEKLRPHQSYDKIDDVVNDGEHEFGYLQLPDDHDDDDMSVSASTGSSHVHMRHRRSLTDWLIAPNTRWCGRGNTANGTYNHLGGASAADKCCRKHDHCQLYIPGMSNRYELFNYRPYTLSHCNCDRRFRTCLKMATDEDANTIGKLFFNMVQTQCFILKSERVCQQRAADGSCERQLVKQKAYLRNNKKF